MKHITTLLFVFLLFTASNINARHILSANMTYTCNGNGNYTFDLVMHRDCNSGGAAFDQEIPITVFKGSELIMTLSNSIHSTETIEYQAYETCDPNAEFICLQKGLYTFDINLPIVNDEYHIVYQRCCWASDIINMVDPSETGITVEAVITAKGQELCNSQTAIDFPMAITTCPDIPFSFPLPDTDAEGDELQYLLCTPFKGGGVVGSSEIPGDPTSCDGLIPTPACPPPYNYIEYAEGFSEENPFPTVDGFNFNSSENKLEFIPSEIGRYIFGLCVNEYRNGELIGYSSTTGSVGNVVMPMTSSSQENQLDHWNVYHSLDAIRIQSINSQSKTKVQVYSSQGSLISSNDYENTSNIEISTIDYAKGMYYVHLSENGYSTVKKVIIQ